MKTEVSIMRMIHAKRIDVFNYFIDPKLLETWAAPVGMTLKVPYFDAKIGGTYRFEHTGKDGVYVCTGVLHDFQPGSKLVQIDRGIGPDKNILFTKLETVTTFSEKPGGTFVTITIKGFTDERSMNECEKSWNECLDTLDSFFSANLALNA